MKLNLAIAATAALAASNTLVVVVANEENNHNATTTAAADDIVRQEQGIIAALESLDLQGALNDVEETALEKLEADVAASMESATPPAEVETHEAAMADLILDFDEAEAGNATATEVVMPEMMALSGAAIEQRNGHDDLNSTVEEDLTFGPDSDAEVLSESGQLDSSEPAVVSTHHETPHQRHKEAKAEKDHAAEEASSPPKKSKSGKHGKSAKAKHGKSAKKAHGPDDATPVPSHGGGPHSKALKGGGGSGDGATPATIVDGDSGATPVTLLNVTSDEGEEEGPVMMTNSTEDNDPVETTNATAESASLLPDEDDTAEEEDAASSSSTTVPPTIEVKSAEELAPPAAPEVAMGGGSVAVPRTPDEKPSGTATGVDASSLQAEKFGLAKDVLLNGASAAVQGATTNQHHTMKESVDKLDVRDKPRASSAIQSANAGVTSGGSAGYARSTAICLVASSAVAYVVMMV
mmetsp:Transcript_11419/g.28131  ORF Transcript_11419/g.28131 Transcript_11419/m.28131 type:complete len:466 (+) Transcript_11419:156-1553(+)|eukprot:CAMPEP_0181108278 /NCGR_PEP_ID=MMETSP1071-20121207/17544_1 /TAXON_ID=35127 /ORGANISM="Thalassiosira sp., Strain NH16" /LENGTH=465 /DNA_ID=CAMNT_0023191869 /DNA_START=244 /DNA_END=1641 /DNA_ORIENTATION=-